jgi:hypothetical protein
MQSNHRLTARIILVSQEVMAALNSNDTETGPLQGRKHLTRRNCRKPAHIRASLTGTSSLIVLRGAESDGGNRRPSC